MNRSIERIVLWIVLGIIVAGCSSKVMPTQISPIPTVGFTPQSKCLVPDVVGLSQVAAERMLAGLGLQPVWTNRYDSFVPPGTVVSQDPLDETLLTPCQGDVTVVLSLGMIPETSPIPASTSTPTPSTDSAGDWTELTSPELGLRFEFPALPGEVTYEYNEWPERDWDPTGTLVEWKVARSDTNYGAYTFAGCASSDMMVGREGNPTTLTGWSRTEENMYFVELPCGREELVEALEVVTRSDGLQGLIFVPSPLYNQNHVSRSAILNLPEGQHQKVHCISFYFLDETSSDDIERVLQSVVFE